MGVLEFISLQEYFWYMLTSYQRENLKAGDQLQYENWSCSPKAREKEKKRRSPRNSTFYFLREK